MHLKRKTKNGFLDSLQEANKTKVIGILGSQKGDGVTTMSIAMANYLAEIMSMKTAIVECNETAAFERMKDNYMGKDASDNCFVVGKVTYYFSITMSDFFATYANRYEYVIVDFGTSIKNYYGNLSKIKYRIVIGSIMPYKVFYHENLLEKEGLEEAFHLLYGDDKNVREYSKKHKISALPIPMIVNPYVIESKLANFFQVLF